MENKIKIEEAVEWYTNNLSLYNQLASKVESDVKDILRQENINFHSVTSRAKDVSEYKEKALRKKYKDPKTEIKDMAGVRIITYLDSDAKKIEEVIRSSFVILPEHSIDKTEELGVDRVGYRSIHCVGTFAADKYQLDEYRKFSGLCFEIQIRTILQHAWAEFEHDRNYKFKGVLPRELKRRLAIIAGNLELMDWTFEQLATSINDYVNDIHKKTDEGDLSLRITSASLNVYLRSKFDELVKHGLQPILLSDAQVINELSLMGISTLKQLDDIIPLGFKEKAIEFNCIETYTNVLREIMMIYNAGMYFEKAWNKSWFDLTSESIDLLKYYQVPIEEYIRRYGLDIGKFYETPDYEIEYEPPEYEPDYEPPDEEPPEIEMDYEPPDEEPPEEDMDYEPPDEERPDEEPPEY